MKAFHPSPGGEEDQAGAGPSVSLLLPAPPPAASSLFSKGHKVFKDDVVRTRPLVQQHVPRCRVRIKLACQN